MWCSVNQSLINLLTPVPLVTGRDEPWPFFTFDQIGIIYTQLLQEEKIFPMMPRSEWSAEWSLTSAAEICTKMLLKSWVNENHFVNFTGVTLALYINKFVARHENLFYRRYSSEKKKQRPVNNVGKHLTKFSVASAICKVLKHTKQSLAHASRLNKLRFLLCRSVHSTTATKLCHREGEYCNHIVYNTQGSYLLTSSKYTVFTQISAPALIHFSRHKCRAYSRAALI